MSLNRIPRFLFRSKRRAVAIGFVVALLIPLTWVTAKLVKTSHSQIWFPSYAQDLLSGRYNRNSETEHLIFLMCDHWEPGYGEKSRELAANWLNRFEAIALENLDSQGRPFQYSWFYPIDNFDPLIMGSLSQKVRKGIGEIEVHWHHRHKDSQSFESDLKAALMEFQKFGALVSEEGGLPRFAFIHGNWTLDNSGAEKFCGVNDEISILLENGCYADMTFPAIGTPSQPSTINRIFYSADTPGPKSYEVSPVVSRIGNSENSLMMLPGPLGLNFLNPLILIENGSLDDAEGTGFSGRLKRPRTPRDYFIRNRVALWDRLASRVEGFSQWAFVKIHAHGVQHRDILLGGAMEEMLSSLREYCEMKNIKLHFVTAREAFNLVKAAESEMEGPPENYYDFVIPPPLNRMNFFPLSDGNN